MAELSNPAFVQSGSGIAHTPPAPTWSIALSVGLLVALLLFAIALALIDVGKYGNDDSGDGGDGPSRPGPQDPGPPSGDPDWWPEFERQFGAYVRDCARVDDASER